MNGVPATVVLAASRGHDIGNDSKKRDEESVLSVSLSEIGLDVYGVLVG